MTIHPKPWIMVSPRSDSHRNRTVPDDVWSSAAREFKGTAFWLGRHDGPKHFIDLRCRRMEEVIEYLSVSDLFVGVDSGPAHIAIALGIPAIVIEQASSPDLHFSDKRDFVTIRPAGLNCLNCQETLCPIDADKPPCQNIRPEIISNAVNKRLDWTREMKVSAVVPTHRAKLKTLNRCLSSLIPQVDEIVVTSDKSGVIPAGSIQHPKIRYTQSWQSGIGYGRNTQWGVRHTFGGWVLLCNDDVELHPNCVKNMLAEGKPEVGIVSCLLRYRDGTIQHAGKSRNPNEKGWGHLDYRKMNPTIKQPAEQENTCGALQLVRRKCFYDAGAFDEDFFLYCEDDSFCLSARLAGWKIIYTPHASAIHDEHQSTEKIPHIYDIMMQSNALFGKKWGKYLEWNATRIPGNFDYLKP